MGFAFSALTRLGFGLLELNRVQVDVGSTAVFSTRVANTVVYSDHGVLFVTGKTTVIMLGSEPGCKKIAELKGLLGTGQKIINLTLKELESHSTQVTQARMLTLDDLGPRQGIYFV